MRLAFDRPASQEEAAAVMAAVVAMLAEEAQPAPLPTPSAWQQAARLEGLGLARRVQSRAELPARR